MMPGPQPQTAIIVSHGQPSEPEVAEAELAEVCAALRLHMPDWSVLSATLAAPDALKNAMDQAGSAPLIYPLFMTDGWFTKTALPKRLHNPNARILAPLGVDPALVLLATKWLTTELSRAGWSADETTLIVAGHGSGRSTNSARDTDSFANAVQDRLAFKELRLGFVEETPFLADAMQEAGPKSICLPFFAACRGHVLDDIPEAMKKADFQGLRLDPIGLHLDVIPLIAEAIRSAQHRATQSNVA
ncbi:MAG: CbiX/SirB N-terminal domain-containing protein [Pseudomonadota bacterium]